MADRPTVGLVVPNLFLRVPLDAAIRAAGAVPVALADGAAALGSSCPVVLLDLDAVPDAATVVRGLVAKGRTVLASGPHVHGDLLAVCRAAGAVVLPRGAFLARLPELLGTALAPFRPAP